MKLYPPDPGYVERQRAYNWRHTNGELVSQGDLEKSVRLAQRLEEYLTPPPQTILVLGCRAGYEVEALIDKFDALVIGVDIVPEFIHIASLKVPALCADMHSLLFPDDSFDLTVCEGSLEHCYDPAMALREIYRITRGTVYITADLEPDRGAYKSHYAFSEDPEEWLKLYRDCGFEVKQHWIEPASNHNGLYAYLTRGAE